MAKVSGVWGLDIGDCALKALRCMPDNTTGRVRADAFDYIEYPKILSQPDAKREELVADAIQQFLSRNDVREDQIAINVPGQNGLARFIKLPPVESKKIPDIVKYEARQQIPFDLADVVWDFQKMAGGSESEGFSLETEVGLFAMKRDQAFRQLQPYSDAKIDVDLIQLAPLALYNYVVADQMPRLPETKDYDPESPPDSVMVMSIGTETTDLVITNGFRVWQRSIPVGGSHFTKALSKEMRQTFAKSEHLKRNATQAENPKALFQAMRPVFTDLVTEVQRSLNFFGNIDKKAKIARGVALGGGSKLPGLVRFLEQNLNMPIERVDSFATLVGPGVVDVPAFKEHTPSFGICYGLCLQGLGDGKLGTNLMPGEIVHERLIEAKKPWAVAAVAVLMLAIGLSFAGNWYEWHITSPSYGNRESVETKAKNSVRDRNADRSAFVASKAEFDNIDKVGQIFVQNELKREYWPKLLKVISAATIAPPDVFPDEPAEYEDLPDRLEVELVVSVPGNYEAWKKAREESGSFARTDEYKNEKPGQNAAADTNTDPDIDPNADPNALPQGNPGGGGQGMDDFGGPAGGPPTGGGAPANDGYIVYLRGYHDHNPPEVGVKYGAEAYLANTLITNLEQDVLSFEVPKGDGSAETVTQTINVKELGIKDPVIDVDSARATRPGDAVIPNPAYDPLNPASQDVPQQITVRRYFFDVQFFWQPPPLPEGESLGGIATASSGTSPGTD